MKLLTAVFILGLIIQYFMDTALRLENINLEMFIHNLIRFFTGFIILGIWVSYKHKLKLKIALYLVVALLLADHIADYMRSVDNLKLEMLIHESYLILWGALMGFLSMRCFNRKKQGN